MQEYARGALSDEDFVKRLDRRRPLRSGPGAPAPNQQAPEGAVTTERATQVLEGLLDAQRVERSAADPQRVFLCFCSFLRMPLWVGPPAELDEELVFVEWTPSPASLELSQWEVDLTRQFSIDSGDDGYRTEQVVCRLRFGPQAEWPPPAEPVWADDGIEAWARAVRSGPLAKVLADPHGPVTVEVYQETM